MKEDFVTYDLAVKLKEKGFNGKCFAYYMPKGSELIFNKNQFRGGIVEDCLYSNNSLPNECMASDFVDAPTISQVLKWLREEKKIHVTTGVTPKSAWRYIIMFCDERGLQEPTITEKNHPCYSSAVLAGIEYVINNLI